MPEVHEGIGRIGHASWHKCWNCCSDSGNLQSQTAAVSLTETESFQRWVVDAEVDGVAVDDNAESDRKKSVPRLSASQ